MPRGRRSGRRKRGSRRRWVFSFFSSLASPLSSSDARSPSSRPSQAKAREEAIARGEFDPSASRRGGSRGGGRGGARGSARGGRGGFRGGAEFSHSSRGEPAAKKGRWGAQDGEADAGYKSKGGKVAPIAGGNPIEDFDSDPLSSSDDSDGSSDSDSDSGSDIDPVKDAVSSRLPSAPSARPPPAADDEMEDEDAPEVEENVRTLEGTRLCTYFLTPQGCKMGDRCRFVHDGSKRPVAPVRSSLPSLFSSLLTSSSSLFRFPLVARSCPPPASLPLPVHLPLPRLPSLSPPARISCWVCSRRTSSTPPRT